MICVDGRRKTAVLYARVSSDEQEKEGFSIPAQMKLLKDYAAREGFDVVAEYVDVETAKAPGRTGFGQMIRFFQKQNRTGPRVQQCRTLLVEKTDRLYRNLSDYVTIDALNIDVHFVKEGVVLSPSSHSSEKFMHGIKVLMAKNYVDNLSEETKKGMLEKARQGLWPLKAPIGYRNTVDAAGRKVVEPDPVAAPIIQRMYEQYATGNFSLDSLTAMTREAGLTAPRSGKPVDRSHVHKILCNPFYYGKFNWKGRIYEGIHTPLVSRDLWMKVKDILRDRGRRKPKQSKKEFAFSGLVTCGHCGCALVAEIQKGRYIYYHCTGYKQKCPEPYVREEVLEQHFARVLGRLAFDEEIVGVVRQAILDSHQHEKNFHAESIQRLQAEYRRYQNRIETAYEDRLDGRIEPEQYDRKTAEWRDAQSEIRESIERHESANHRYLDDGVALLDLANRAVELFEKQPPREKRRLLNFVLSNCSWSDGELTPDFRQPFDMIAVASSEQAQKKAAEASSSDLCQLRGG